TGAIHANPLSIATQMTPPGPAITAKTTGNMPFARHAVADVEPADLLPDLNDLAHIFMAHMHGNRNRLAGPVVPLPDMNIGAADGGFPNLDQDIVMANNRPLDIGQCQANGRFKFCEGAHGGLQEDGATIINLRNVS